MPDNWSRDVGTRILLKELCRTSVYARCLANDAEAARTALTATPDNSQLRKEWLALLRAFNLQAQRIADLSTKLRLTRQSRQSARRGEQITSAGSSRRPWTDWGLEDNSGDTKQ